MHTHTNTHKGPSKLTEKDDEDLLTVKKVVLQMRVQSALLVLRVFVPQLCVSGVVISFLSKAAQHIVSPGDEQITSTQVLHVPTEE